jgi:uncharacterized membrane protein YbhN (UPF0104 family)
MRSAHASLGRWVLLLSTVVLVVFLAGHLYAAGASWSRSWQLLADLGWQALLGLGVVWLLGLWVHTVVLTASLPGLTHLRALTLNLSGSAVSNMLPLGGLAGTSLNLGMIRGWGHSTLDFARFVLVSKGADLVAKLVMPFVAVTVLLLYGAVPHGGPLWLLATAVAAVAGLLVVAALLGRARPLLLLAGAAQRLGDRLLRRAPPTTWTAAAAGLLDGTDRLVRQGWPRLVLGTAAYWLLQGALLWCCCVAVGIGPAPPVVLAALVAERALTLLAITPGGAGLVETGTIGVLIALGVDPTAALAVVLLFRAFVFAAEIPVGGLATGLWLVSRRRSRSAA